MSGPQKDADVSSLIVISSAAAVPSGAVKDALQGLVPNAFLIENFGSTESGFNGTGVRGDRRQGASHHGQRAHDRA
jgi:hypothetical protein